MTELLPGLANPWWLLLLGALPLLAWHHHRRQSLGALTYSRLPLQASWPQAPPFSCSPPPTSRSRSGPRCAPALSVTC